MFCMLFQGFYRWAAQVPALLQGLCSEHASHAQSADYRLPLPQSGPPAEVKTTLYQNITNPSLGWVLVAIFPSQISVRTLLRRRARGCRSYHLPSGEHPFIRERQHVSHCGCVSVRWVVVSLPCVFPQGVKLLSYLYNEAQNNCSNENYPVLLSLLKTSCEPYTRSVAAKKCS